MPVKKNVVSHLNSSKCSVYQLVDQNWNKIKSQSIYFVKHSLGGMPPDSYALHVDCVSHNAICKIPSTGIASIPSYKFII